MVLTNEEQESFQRAVSDDLVMMTQDLSDESIHDMLWSRFRQGDIYTTIGSVLISVNPYQKVRKGGKLLYCEEVAKYYADALSGDLKPHIFTIADASYQHLKNYDKNQAIVVTGESGAGKTEAAKSLMSFLTFQSSKRVAEEQMHTVDDFKIHNDHRPSGDIADDTGLTHHEVTEIERRMKPEEKLNRALALMNEREKKKLKERKSHSAKLLNAHEPCSEDGEKLKSYFNSKSKAIDGEGEKTVTSAVFERLPHLKDLLRDGIVKNDFVEAVSDHINATQGENWNFASFKNALQLVEIEVMHSDPLRKKSRKFSNFNYDDNFVVKMEYETNPLKLNALHELKSQLLESNPVLEMFGNSKTIRNDNSSRFGKYVELQFDPGFSLVGGRVTTYLLEKARLVHQTAGERNFHVLHVFCEGSSKEEKDKFMLEETPDMYNYLMNSAKEFEDLPSSSQKLKSLSSSLLRVGIAKHRLEDIYYLLSGILSLGNLTFERGETDEEPLRVSNTEELDKCAALLCVDPEDLESALVKHKLYHGNDTCSQSNSSETTRPRKQTMATRHHSLESALSVRDSLAKDMYNRMFLWIVSTINENIDYVKHHKRTVGILDIYGFEIFELNGFEQFCINWCNEKLQQFFIDQTIRAEQNEYDAEGIPWTTIDYFDNSVVLSLVEGKPGLISMLDDQNATKNTRDGDKYSQAIESKLQSNKFFITPQKSKINTGSNGVMFGVNHYAGVVYYSTAHFTEKNNDVLVNDLLRLMTESKSNFISKLFEDKRSEAEKLKKPPTLGTQFKKDLNALVGALSQCKPHYVRCIKPNELKKPNQFDKEKVIHQIRYLGLLENIKVRRAGYCYRADFKAFVDRFRVISSLTWRTVNNGSYEQQVLDILTGASPTKWKNCPLIAPCSLVEKVDFRMGLTKVFIKDPMVIFNIERDRKLAVNALVRSIQAECRRYLASKRYACMRLGFIKCQASARCYLGRKHYQKVRNDLLRLQCLIRRFLERCRYHRMVAQFKGRPPRSFANLIQKHFRGFVIRRQVYEENKEKYHFLRDKINNIVNFGKRVEAQTVIARNIRCRRERSRFLQKKMASNRIRFHMLVKLRWLRKERQIAKDIKEAVAQWRSSDGMKIFKCQANGTKASEKIFRINGENNFVWNAGYFSKMKGGVELHNKTLVLKGGHTFRNEEAERETLAIDIKSNPFKQKDLQLKAMRNEGNRSPPPNMRESEFRREDMVQRSITIANPPDQELVIVLDTPELRDKIFTVLRRFSAQFEPSSK